MAQLKIYVVPTGQTHLVNVNLTTDTVEAVIKRIPLPAETPAPDGDAAGGTIWKMTKAGKSNGKLGSCIPDPGFMDGETIYLIEVPA